MGIARKMAVDVSQDGELVKLKIGELTYSLEFDLALRISALLLVEGRAARRIALGVNAFPRFRSEGVLTDLNASKKRRKRWETLATNLKNKDVSVVGQGATVSLRFGKQVMDLPWNGALAIAQWLRIHGKGARNQAGEKAHWSEIAGMKVRA
jgi:hypothetical protein